MVEQGEIFFGNITKSLNRIAKIGNGHMHAGGES
jgi:hypothetical protein